MKLLGFCDWYSQVIRYKEKEYVVKDINDEIFYCRKPSPPIITLAELDALPESEKEKVMTQKLDEWKEYNEKPWIIEFKEKGEALEKLREECCNFLKETFLKKKWRFPGSAYQDEWVPVIEDDNGEAWKFRVSQRAWGGFIYRVECERNHIEPNDEMGYCDWYLQNGRNNNTKPIYPKKSLMLETVEYEKEEELI